MKCKNRKLTLIVAANPKAYASEGGMYARELAGSVPAHYLHLLHLREQKRKNKLGVFFTCGFKHDGLAKFFSDDNFKEEEKEKLLRNFGTPIKNLQISQDGYFYESGYLTWCFKAEGLRTYQEIEDAKLNDYLPYFQLEGIKKRKKEGDLKEDERKWLLIRELKRLKTPLSNFKDFKIHTKEGTHSLKKVYPSAYVIHTKEYSTEEPKFEDMISDVLIDVFSGREKLREEHIHRIFLYYLEYRGYLVTDEGKVKTGRFDVAYQHEGGHVIVELKIGVADKSTMNQLEDYASEYIKKEKIKNKKCKRIIICKKASEDLSSAVEDRTKRGYDYEIIEYKLKTSFPGLFPERKQNLKKANPIHTEHPEMFKDLVKGVKVECPEVGRRYVV